MPLKEVDFDIFLYLRPEHLALQGSVLLCYYWLQDEKSHKIVACLPVFINGAEVKSPLKGPFGGVQFTEDLPLQALNCFMESVQNDLKLKGISKVTVVPYPGGYAPDQQAML
ncbi:MAG: hypothetical protein LPK19_16170, partial [Hymenobacteraceae bacterium]|nr:hypothetical protein [Hymenobacteraceae bacterium]MDX5513859.1 hypothetical protein [Hymenobacteraceae bacterium]